MHVAARARGILRYLRQKSYFSDNNFLVYKGVFKFFKQLNDNVKVKMFFNDSSRSATEFYYLDELNFLENEP